jgi:hypothetical protein
MHEHVAGADRAPDIRRPLEGGHGMRGKGPVFEPRDVDRGIELEQIGERGESLALVQILGSELELV